AYLRAATSLRSKSQTFEPGLTSRIRVLLVLYCSGITDTSSSTSSAGTVGFRTFLCSVRVLRISTRYLPGRRPRLISYFPSLLIPPPPPRAADPRDYGQAPGETLRTECGITSRSWGGLECGASAPLWFCFLRRQEKKTKRKRRGSGRTPNRQGLPGSVSHSPSLIFGND